MKHINFFIVILAVIILTHGTALSSGMKEKNKKDWAAQEDIYKLTKEFKDHKRKLHSQREDERRRKKYQKGREWKKTDRRFRESTMNVFLRLPNQGIQDTATKDYTLVAIVLCVKEVTEYLYQ